MYKKQDSLVVKDTGSGVGAPGSIQILAGPLVTCVTFYFGSLMLSHMGW